jgi:hypothetical protein
MSNLTGHGILKCGVCNKVIAQCRCMSHDHVEYDICDNCKIIPRIVKFYNELERNQKDLEPEYRNIVDDMLDEIIEGKEPTVKCDEINNTKETREERKMNIDVDFMLDSAKEFSKKREKMVVDLEMRDIKELMKNESFRKAVSEFNYSDKLPVAGISDKDMEKYDDYKDVTEELNKVTTTTNATEETYIDMKQGNEKEKVVIYSPLWKEIPEYYARQIKINIYKNGVVKIDWEGLQKGNAYIIEKEDIIKYLEQAIEILNKK